MSPSTIAATEAPDIFWRWTRPSRSKLNEWASRFVNTSTWGSNWGRRRFRPRAPQDAVLERDDLVDKGNDALPVVTLANEQRADAGGVIDRRELAALVRASVGNLHLQVLHVDLDVVARACVS